MIVFDSEHPDLLCDALGRAVARMDDRDQLRRLEVLASEVSACRSRLGGEAVTLAQGGYVVSNFELADPVYFLPGQTTVSDELAGERFDDPESVSMLGVVLLVPGNPRSGLVAGLRRGVVLHDPGVAQKASHHVEVRGRHLTKAKSGGVPRNHLYTVAEHGKHDVRNYVV